KFGGVTSPPPPDDGLGVPFANGSAGPLSEASEPAPSATVVAVLAASLLVAWEAMATPKAAALLSRPLWFVPEFAVSATAKWAALPALWPGKESPTGRMLDDPSPKPLKKVPIGTRSSSSSTRGLRFGTTGARFLSLTGRARRTAISKRHVRNRDNNDIGT